MRTRSATCSVGNTGARPGRDFGRTAAWGMSRRWRRSWRVRRRGVSPGRVCRLTGYAVLRDGPAVSLSLDPQPKPLPLRLTPFRAATGKMLVSNRGHHVDTTAQNNKGRLTAALSQASDLSQKIWSGRRDSNPRPQPWQGCALPLSYARIRSRARGSRRLRGGWQGLPSHAARTTAPDTKIHNAATGKRRRAP